MGKTLFIDYDGTLHDTDSVFAAGLDGIYGLSGQTALEAFVKVHRGIVHLQYPEQHDDFLFHQKLLCEQLGWPYDETEARETARRFSVAREQTWLNPSFFSDSLNFLERVYLDHVLCLTTGDNAWEKAEAIQKATGSNFFTYTFDQTRLGIKGSSSTYYNNALTLTNSHPDDVIVIGDSLEHDVTAAKETGIRAVWVNRKGLSLPDESPAPDYQASNLLDVLDYLASI